MSTTIERLIAAGHQPRLDDEGGVDLFAIDYGHHNGPMCDVCHEGRCQHCDDGSPFDPCPGAEEVERRATEARRQQYLKLKEEFDV